MNSTRRTKLSCVSMEGSILACRLHIAERRAKKSCPTYDSKNAQWKRVDKNTRNTTVSAETYKRFVRVSIFTTTRNKKCYNKKPSVLHKSFTREYRNFLVLGIFWKIE